MGVQLQTVSGVAEVRRAAYGAVATRALNYDHLFGQVTATKWDIAELRSQHSAYVDFLLHVRSASIFTAPFAISPSVPGFYRTWPISPID